MNKRSTANWKTFLFLLAVMIIALSLRVLNVGWDNGIYLHPDERFLAMVATGLKLPNSWNSYFNPTTSTLNPYNTGNGFFVYGHFPLNLAKLLAVFLGYDDYGFFYQLTRPLSALFDASIPLALYLIATKVITNQNIAKKAGVFAALSYAVMVFPIQQAHFFTTDTFVNAFFLWSLTAVLWARSWPFLLLSAVLYGLGQASKISMAYTLPLILVFLAAGELPHWRRLISKVLVFAIVSYLALRLTDPYLFAHANWFDPRPAAKFVENLVQLKSFDKGITFPPIVQWHSTGFFFPLKNLAIFGLGIGFSLISLLGLWFWWVKRESRLFLFSTSLWILLLYSYLSLQVAKTMRYYFFFYPLLALYIGYALAQLHKLMRLLLFIIATGWTLAFMHIYLTPHPRIVATNWVNNHLPTRATILWEEWDDPLPLFQLPHNQFQMISQNFYGPDNPEKWRLIATKLAHSDYLIHSSNRQWGSIGKASDLYPQGARYYQLLQAEKLGFKRLKTFSSFPTLKLGPFIWEFPDQWSEEAFTVFDHPQVDIYQRTKQFSRQQFLKQIYDR